MTWLKRNWKAVLLAAAAAVAAVTGERTIAHRAADKITEELGPKAPAAPPSPAP